MSDDLPEIHTLQRLERLERQALAHRLLLQQLLAHRLVDWRNPDEVLGLRAICDAELRDWTKKWPKLLAQPYARGGEQALAEIDGILDYAKEVATRELANRDGEAKI